MFNYCFLIADDIDDVSLLKYVEPIDRRLISLPPPTLAPNKYLFERRSVSQGKLLPRHDYLDMEVNRVAVAYQDACSPVLKAVTKSILNVVQR